MKIILSPQRRDDKLSISKNGDTLVINGTSYDFSGISDGESLSKDSIDCQWIVSDVERIEGLIHLTLFFPITADASEGARFPNAIVNPPDGIVELPK